MTRLGNTELIYEKKVYTFRVGFAAFFRLVCVRSLRFWQLYYWCSVRRSCWLLSSVIVTLVTSISAGFYFRRWMFYCFQFSIGQHSFVPFATVNNIKQFIRISLQIRKKFDVLNTSFYRFCVQACANEYENKLLIFTPSTRRILLIDINPCM